MKESHKQLILEELPRLKPNSDKALETHAINAIKNLLRQAKYSDDDIVSWFLLLLRNPKIGNYEAQLEIIHTLFSAIKESREMIERQDVLGNKPKTFEELLIESQLKDAPNSDKTQNIKANKVVFKYLENTHKRRVAELNKKPTLWERTKAKVWTFVRDHKPEILSWPWAWITGALLGWYLLWPWWLIWWWAAWAWAWIKALRKWNARKKEGQDIKFSDITWWTVEEVAKSPVKILEPAQEEEQTSEFKTVLQESYENDASRIIEELAHTRAKELLKANEIPNNELWFSHETDESLEALNDQSSDENFSEANKLKNHVINANRIIISDILVSINPSISNWEALVTAWIKSVLNSYEENQVPKEIGRKLAEELINKNPFPNATDDVSGVIKLTKVNFYTSIAANRFINEVLEQCIRTLLERRLEPEQPVDTSSATETTSPEGSTQWADGGGDTATASTQSPNTSAKRHRTKKKKTNRYRRRGRRGR